MGSEEIIVTLNDLVDLRKDGEASYKTCVADATAGSSRLQTMFRDMQHECAVAASELQDLVCAIGGQVRTDSGADSGVYRAWLDLRSSIVDGNDEAILVDCEYEEDTAVRRYKVVLDLDLPSEVRMIVDRQYQGVLVNHGQVKMLRNHLKVEL